ncbi:uncharacterized protein H6S33_004876 [Morchella sextelata]|uniref:uncharacterized protein n=1 Tax=Morchella sextelata TaxID=1174677 RepID=UPI001D04798B|nr:uncharacterized protein H6S33_004876 [Morchella sextelata]KAH0605654.1 hypothetical protein H6S33_004876 [Morchella sextelata]
MHWRTPRDKSPICNTPILLDRQEFQPRHQVRWVGFWLSPSFNPNTHFLRRLASARSAFGLIQHFSSAGKGLSSRNCQKAATLAIRPMLTYGANVLTPTSALKPMTTFWNSVLRWATGCFRATNRKVLWAEANTHPLDLYLHYLKCKYAIRILQASPLGNPVTGRTSPSFPTISNHRTYSHTQLLKGLPNPSMKWNSTALKGVTHLPIEFLGSLLVPLIREGIAPERMNRHAKTQLLINWQLYYAPPEYYAHPLSTTPLPFNELHKFVATRIHQFRAGKSYLRAQKTWMTAHTPSTCERCNAAEETPEYVILHCPKLAPVVWSVGE